MVFCLFLFFNVLFLSHKNYYIILLFAYFPLLFCEYKVKFYIIYIKYILEINIFVFIL